MIHLFALGNVLSHPETGAWRLLVQRSCPGRLTAHPQHCQRAIAAPDKFLAHHQAFMCVTSGSSVHGLLSVDGSVRLMTILGARPAEGRTILDRSAPSARNPRVRISEPVSHTSSTGVGACMNHCLCVQIHILSCWIARTRDRTWTTPLPTGAALDFLESRKGRTRRQHGLSTNAIRAALARMIGLGTEDRSTPIPISRSSPRGADAAGICQVEPSVVPSSGAKRMLVGDDATPTISAS
jgi:hypothetical protein